jgi:hypothetical protein
MKNPLKNGIELTIQLQVLCEFIDQYPVKREVKQAANALRKASEKDLEKQYAKVYAMSPEMSINICQKTAELAETIGKMDISELVLFSDFAKRFYDEKEIVKEKGMSFFNKILL